MISIIIPIYNGEKFVDRCLLSIVNQTYKELEIILVDDGSFDNTYSVCKKWQEKDNRVKLYRKENGGVSSARNFGIDKATGNYMAFIDIDDEIDKVFFENFMEKFKNTECDIVICNYYMVSEKQKSIGIDKIEEDNYQTELLKNDSFMGFVFNKIYKKEIIENVRFNEKIKIYEDLLFNIEIAQKKPKYQYIDLPIYIYNQVETSAMHTNFKKDASRFYANIRIIEILEKMDEIKLADARKYYYILDFKEFTFENKNFKDNVLEDKYNKYCKYLFKNSKNKVMILKVFFIKNFYAIYRKLQSIKRNILNKEG